MRTNSCEKFCLQYYNNNNECFYYVNYNKTTSGLSRIENIIEYKYEIAIMSKVKLEKIIKQYLKGNKNRFKIKFKDFKIIKLEIFYNEYNMHAALS